MVTLMCTGCRINTAGQHEFGCLLSLTNSTGGALMLFGYSTS